ncbi:hypothetical protein [uncultured Thiodictyon sp.]|nr:hypothetical protein [uncultured Thiodictyon sp.]
MRTSQLAANAAGLLAVIGLNGNALACSACGCTLSTEWGIQGITQAPGFSLDLVYQYYNQTILTSGTGSLHRGRVGVPADREVQRSTENSNYTAFLNYASTNWGVTLQIPYIDRSHSTIAAGDTDYSTSHSAGVGDVRIVGRYFGWSRDHSIGVQFGLKLPTGRFDETFHSGPQAGTPIDRGLQPGSGTTDLLLGLSRFGALSRNWDWFAQGLLQQPLNSRNGYMPGTGFNLNLGLRYVAFERVSPQLQLNARIDGRESGVNSDQANSGGSRVYVSPGITVKLAKRAYAYAFVSLPVYHNVYGYQLDYAYAVSGGIQISF